MMQVDRNQCRGCGECQQVCPVEAISMLDGKAVIDSETCTACGACITVCPEAAIRFTRIGAAQAAQTALTVHPDLLPAANVSAPTPSLESRLAWAKPALAFVGREIVPRLAETLLVALDRRLSGSHPEGQQGSIQQAPQPLGGRRQMRRRRGRWF